jgi:hypothetical protein
MSGMLLTIKDLAVSEPRIKLPDAHTRTCACGTPITSSDRRVKHCSADCAVAAKRLHRNARQAAYREAHPERERAKLTLNNAIRAGNIRRCTRCEECGERGFIEAHHSDYSRPYYVTWLCKSCHASLEDGRHFGAGQVKHAAQSAPAIRDGKGEGY